MSLSSKIALILTAVIGIYAVANDQIQQHIFFQRFEDVEERQALKDIARVEEALLEEVAKLDRVNLRWAHWDDAYAYIADHNEGFERANLTETVLGNQGVDLLFVCDIEGLVLWSSITDPDQPGEPIKLRDFPTGRLYLSHPLLTSDTQLDGGTSDPERRGNHRSGVLLTEHKPLLVSARSILDSRQRGPARGTLITGRFLSGELDRELTEKTKVDFDFWQIDGRHDLGHEIAQVVDAATSSPEALVEEQDSGTLHVYKTFNDLRERPEILLRANVERDITATGKSAFKFGFISTIVGGLVLLLVLMGLLKHIVLGPISRLTHHTVEIGQNEDFRAKLDLDRQDEVGTLSREFDNMMEKLELARQAIVDTARTAGMSEIATGILHNVGNVLNSVNISASIVAQQVDSMSLEDLAKVSKVLEDKGEDLPRFIADDPKGRHLQPLISALTTQLGDERETILGEVTSLTEGIEHICELIKSQQSFAVKSELIEPVILSEKIDEALSITDKAITHDTGLEVVRSYCALPELMIEKHKLLEILVNLIQNARQAMSGAGIEQRQLELVLATENDDRFRIEVRDNGPGISEENLVKVFNLGFTTKASGHGYGLHTAANAATEMGGTLSVHSDGPGHGARFVLDLPLNVVPVAEGAQ
ncbi:MAG: HAMP domain-containing protein [bacterium]|nr:HAMP domain-containing protein [bacterium]